MIVWQSQFRELLLNAPTHGIPSGPGWGTISKTRRFWLRHLPRGSSAKRTNDRQTCHSDPRRGKMVFRLRPKYQNTVEQDDKPWVWTLVLAQSASPQAVRDVETAASCAKPSALKMQPQISQDGPSGETADCSNQWQKKTQGEKCWKFSNCQTRSRKVPEQEEEEGETTAGGIIKTSGNKPSMVASFTTNATSCQCTPRLCRELITKGLRLLGTCGSVGGAKWLLALTGAPLRLLTEAIRGTVLTGLFLTP